MDSAEITALGWTFDKYDCSCGVMEWSFTKPTSSLDIYQEIESSKWCYEYADQTTPLHTGGWTGYDKLIEAVKGLA
jgi:hypothetical protein